MAKAKRRRSVVPRGPVADTVDMPALMAGLFEHMTAGGSVRDYASKVGHDEARLRRWANADEYATQYARAREVQADADVERALEVAAQAAKGEVEPNGARLLVDTLKWRAARFHRNRYGDKATVELTGDPEKPVQHVWKVGDREIPF